jgi:hypothetical protein
MLLWGVLGLFGIALVAEFICGMIMGFESFRTSAIASSLAVIVAAVLFTIRMGYVSWFTLGVLALFPIVWIICQLAGMGLSKIIFRR